MKKKAAERFSPRMGMKLRKAVMKGEKSKRIPKG